MQPRSFLTSWVVFVPNMKRIRQIYNEPQRGHKDTAYGQTGRWTDKQTDRQTKLVITSLVCLPVCLSVYIELLATTKNVICCNWPCLLIPCEQLSNSKCLEHSTECHGCYYVQTISKDMSDEKVWNYLDFLGTNMCNYTMRKAHVSQVVPCFPHPKLHVYINIYIYML